MKVKLKNETIIECSVKEFLELKSVGVIKNGNGKESSILKVPEPIQTSKPKPFISRKRKGRKYFSVKEQNVEDQKKFRKLICITKKENISLHKAFVEVFGRDIGGSDYKKLKKYIGEDVFYKLAYKHTKRKTKVVLKTEKTEKSNRARFVAVEANKLIRGGYGRTEAWQIAAKKWHDKQHTYMIKNVPKVPESFDEKRAGLAKQSTQEFVPKHFPKVWPLTTTGLITFKSMIKHLFANGGKIGYFQCKDHLQVIDGEEWDGRLWAKFVGQVMLNKNKICEYFLQDEKKLKILMQNSYHYITFDKAKKA